ncbi:aldose 1-epimerase family protein [Lysinimonas soli]|uniref:Aldose 1-epimerase family protein n=1 Tax=Lysinimonas soli TaxID=1074233 RepID=A0ABW0NTI1_9MICO
MTAPTILPTGTPYLLEREGVRAEIGSVAAVLRSLSVGGVQLTQPIPAEEPPAMCNGIVLAPWPNRVRAGRWNLDGAAQQLDITEPARGGALHGLLQFTDYELRDRTDAALTLGATIYPQHGWPFLLDTWVRYELEPDGLTVTHGAQNLSDARAPYATGTHPYLRVGEAPIAELELTVPAASYFDVDDRLDPIGEVPVSGTPYDVRAPRRVGALQFDTAFGELSHADPADGRGASAWLTAPDGARTTLWQDLDWGYVQVFTTRVFPTPAGPIDAIAIEPMTAPPDALNSGQGLIWLEPGERWQGAWGLRYRAAP